MECRRFPRAEARHQLGNVFVALGRVDLFEKWVERRESFRVVCILVHEAAVELGDFFAGGLDGSLRLGLLFDDALDLVLTAQRQHGERSVRRQVGRNLEAVEPVPAGVVIEIIAGLDVRVARRQIHAPRLDLRLLVFSAHHGVDGKQNGRNAERRGDHRKPCRLRR
jgi:hypothetical protein